MGLTGSFAGGVTAGLLWTTSPPKPSLRSARSVTILGTLQTTSFRLLRVEYPSDEGPYRPARESLSWDSSASAVDVGAAFRRNLTMTKVPGDSIPTWRGHLIALPTAVAMTAFAYGAHGRDLGQWENDDPAVREWYRTLMQPDLPKASCCGEADAYWCDDVHVRDGPHHGPSARRNAKPAASPDRRRA